MANSREAKGSPYCTDGGHAKPKDRRMLVAPSHPTSDAGEGRSSSGQSGLAADSVECIREVEQHLAVNWGGGVGSMPARMNTDFHRLDPNPQLRGPYGATSFFLCVVHELLAVRRRSAPHQSQWAYTAVRLRHCKSSSHQDRRHGQTSLALL